jgi:hypothetical protein
MILQVMLEAKLERALWGLSESNLEVRMFEKFLRVRYPGKHAILGPGVGCMRCRRLLCGLCNPAIGMAGDDPDRLRRMTAYLEQHR